MAVGDVLLQMITDTDTLLGTNVNYLLGPWIANAKYVARWSPDFLPAGLPACIVGVGCNRRTY